MKSVCWNITSRCNRNCKYCFKFNKDDLSLKQNSIILDKLIDLNIEEIIWGGGEPFLYKDLTKLLKKAKENNIRNEIITNATLLNEKNIDEKIKYIDKLKISLDFVNDELNEKYGIGKDYYKHVKEVIKLAKKNRPDILIQINTVVFKGNYKLLDELYDALLKMEINCWNIISFLPIRGKALEDKKSLYINDKQFEKATNKYKNTKQNFEITIKNYEKMNSKHHIILSSGKLINSEDGKDKIIFEKLL